MYRSILLTLLIAGFSPSAIADSATDLGGARDALRHGQYERAVDGFTLAIQSHRLSNQDLFEAYIGRGSSLLDLQHYERAIADFDAALTLNPQSAMAFANRGVARKRLGQTQPALDDLNTAVELDPKNAVARLNRGGVYAELKLYDDAIKDLDAAIALQPSNGLFLYSRGLIYEERGDLDSAKNDFKAALRLSPDYPPIRMKAGRYGLSQ